MHYRLDNLNKVCFAASRVIDVETCVFLRRRSIGVSTVLASHGLSFPNEITLPDTVSFTASRLLQYTESAYSVEIRMPTSLSIDMQYIAGISKHIPDMGEFAFVAMSRDRIDPVNIRVAEAFMALADLENAILASENLRFTNRPIGSMN